MPQAHHDHDTEGEELPHPLTSTPSHLRSLRTDPLLERARVCGGSCGQPDAYEVAAVGAPHLALDPPQSLKASRRPCLQSKVRAHNATVREVKRAFRESPTAAELRAFLDGHTRLLQTLLTREGVRVY